MAGYGSISEAATITARDDDEDAQPLLASSPRPAPPHAATPYLALLAHAAAAALLTFGLKSALVHFCEVSAPSRVMATMTVKWALMLPCAAFVAWFLWRYARGGGSPWTQSCDCRTVRVPAKMWAGAYLAAWAAYYALYLADDKDTFPSPELSRPRACLWNLLLCLGLGAAAHVAVDARNVLPALVMALAVPFATPDRVPYSVEPSGCPNPIHHAVGAYALVCSLWALRCKDVLVTLVPEEYRGWRPATLARIDHGYTSGKASAPCVVYAETVPLTCAFLSFTYLLCFYIKDDVGHPTLFSDSLYHTSWSYLRPSYVLMFAIYWLKRFGPFWMVLLQAALCGFGVIYFMVLAPLATTKATARGASCFHEEEHLHGRHRHDYYEDGEYFALQSCSSKTYHEMESIGFYLSMVLFVVHGLCSGAWEDKPPTVAGFMGVAASSNFLALVSMGVVSPWLDIRSTFFGARRQIHLVDDKKTGFLIWCLIRYWCGYFCVFFPSLFILVFRRRYLLLLSSIPQASEL